MSEGITLGDVLDGIETGKSFQTSEILARSDELGVLKVSAVSWSEFLPNEAKALAGDYTPAESHRVRQGDLLISRANTRELVGAVVHVEHDYPMRLLSDKTLRLIVDEDCASKDYLLFALRSPQAREHIEHFATGTSDSMRNISQDVIKAIPLWLPPLPEQRQIAACLKAQQVEVETARQAAQVQLQDAALLRQRLLWQAFDALADVPRKALGEWARTTSGSTPSRGDKRYWSPAEIPWVKTGEVAFAPISRTEEAISKQALTECSLKLLPPQTVLIAMYGQGKTRGQSAILEIEATTNQACFAILPNDTWDADFLHHWLMASYDYLRGLSDGRGGNQANLNGGLLNALEIPAPDIDNQRRIVAQLKQQLAEADALRIALEQQLRDLDALPQRILALAFEN
ncbi:TPA: restriction endonuclease subunit S [Aeromonas veronii]|uniref:restriction endonuclease subunit S n=1 Tax=Aeromonas veronii TaxID=654 RepID=UPI0038DA0F03